MKTKGPIQKDKTRYFTLNIAWQSVHVLMYLKEKARSEEKTEDYFSVG